ncbi:MAG: helix-turn-helix transcriptional regulator [Eubacterium sp.]|nr:helix-turn-helix transcriptional regulator [Eubacterium sp.]
MMQTIGERIKILRTEKGLSQRTMSEELDCNKNAISLWETNRIFPSALMLVVLSDYFGVTTDWILKGGER